MFIPSTLDALSLWAYKELSAGYRCVATKTTLGKQAHLTVRFSFIVCVCV